jgi:hypothetical protein
VLTVFGLVWLIAAEYGVLIVPRNASEAGVGYIPYAILMLLTLNSPSERYWPPVLLVTQRRIIIARALLAVVGMLCLTAIAVAIIGRELRSVSTESVFPWVIGSPLLLNGVYVALHWAFRPQNIFGPNVPLWLRNPLGFPLIWILKRAAARKRQAGSEHEHEASE